MRKRPIAVLFRLNEQEHRHLKEQTAASGLSTEQFLRCLIAGTDIKPKPPDELSAVLCQLSGIGNNINQITKLANTFGRVRQEDVDSILRMQEKIWHMVKQL